MKYKEWQSKSARFLAMTGYTLAQFEALLPYFEQAHQDYFTRYYLNGKPRLDYRKYVLHQNSPLNSIEQSLVFILIYKKLNPLQEDHADRFGMTQTQCNQFVHALQIVLAHSLSRAGAVLAQNQAELA